MTAKPGGGTTPETPQSASNPSVTDDRATLRYRAQWYEASVACYGFLDKASDRNRSHICLQLKREHLSERVHRRDWLIFPVLLKLQ
jgi:hypothetical protein